MPITRRCFLAAPAALACAAESPRPVTLLTGAEAGRMHDFAVRDRAGRIEALAQAALTAGPWSVTFQRPHGRNVDASPNDYVSEGPYWFPDPSNPGGPYIRRDGQRNNNRFTGNSNDLHAMSSAVLSLGMGSFFLGRSEYADHAAKVLSVWFLEPKTRMNANLEHGQMIQGINTGRGAGMIDTQSLIHAAHGVELLERSGRLRPGVAPGVRGWYGEYATWMTTSKMGASEKNSGNNHATWWTAQVGAYAAFTGDAALRRMAWNHYRDSLVPGQIRPDGSCPREEVRTLSLHYSSMNLDAFALLCRLAELDGVDLWHFRAPQGGSVERAFHYLLPFTLSPETWTKPQIRPYEPARHYFAGLGGLAMPSEKLRSAYLGIPRGDAPWVQFVDLLVRSSAPR